MKSSPLPATVAVIVNYRRAVETLACVQSLMSGDYHAVDIVVVDNGSGDGSVEAIASAYPSVRIAQLPHNTGFCHGVNVGLQVAFSNDACEYVFIVNNDAVVEKSTLRLLATSAARHPDAGIVAPRLLISETSETVLSYGFRMTNPWNAEHIGMGMLDSAADQQDEERDAVSGCAMLVSREAISQVGVLDEEYFAYYEDVDWCLRMRDAGFTIRSVGAAAVYHPDTRVRDIASPLITYLMARNSLLFLEKRGATWKVRLQLTLIHIRTVIALLTRHARTSGNRIRAAAIIRGLVDAYRHELNVPKPVLAQRA